LSPTEKVVFVHDWLNGMRGGEKCLELAAKLYPDSPIFTLFHEKGKISEAIARHPIKSSWVQRLPSVYTKYRSYLPLFPAAIESLRLPACDIVLSMNHCVAKGVKKPKRSVHVCYCFTPMRYAWGFFDEYFGGKNFAAKLLIKRFLGRLRDWDRASAPRVDHFVAISQHIRERIKRCYGRDSEVIYPPVNTRFYEPDHRVQREDFYLVVSALTGYKRVDLAVKAAKKLKKRLIVIGEGPDRPALQKMAGPETKFLGWQSDAAVRDHYRRAKALLFPGEEDFGIVPVEMQACGGPVIALARGGALETVIGNETGLFFAQADEKSLSAAIEHFESRQWNEEAIRQNAQRFSEERFMMELKSLVQRVTARPQTARA
jgi:glycosyltransferase involved in cell wall biosynthesis